MSTGSVMAGPSSPGVDGLLGVAAVHPLVAGPSDPIAPGFRPAGGPSTSTEITQEVLT